MEWIVLGEDRVLRFQFTAQIDTCSYDRGKKEEHFSRVCAFFVFFFTSKKPSEVPHFFLRFGVMILSLCVCVARATSRPHGIFFFRPYVVSKGVFTFIFQLTKKSVFFFFWLGEKVFFKKLPTKLRNLAEKKKVVHPLPQHAFFFVLKNSFCRGGAFVGYSRSMPVPGRCGGHIK